MRGGSVGRCGLPGACRADRARARAGVAGHGQINGLFEVARDAQSEQFLQWFLEEQVEEEAAMRDLLEVAERTREIPMLLEDYLARETPGKRAG
jgi:hypothetical protein